MKEHVYLKGRKPAAQLRFTPVLLSASILAVLLGFYLQDVGFDNRLNQNSANIEQNQLRIAVYDRAKLGPSIYLCVETINRCAEALETSQKALKQVAESNAQLFIASRIWDSKIHKGQKQAMQFLTFEQAVLLLLA